MKTSLLLSAALTLSMAACSASPDKPDLLGKEDVASQSGDAKSSGPATDEHGDHEHEKAPANAEIVPSVRADDLELLTTWNKGQYTGNEQFSLALLNFVPLP